MLAATAVKTYQKKLAELDEPIREKNKFFSIGADPTRLKILLLLKSNKELCVSDLANILSVSVSAISHQMSYLEQCGMLRRTKTGQTVCYELAPGQHVRQLLAQLEL